MGRNLIPAHSLWAIKIDWCMGGIDVTTEDDTLSGIHSHDFL